MVGQSQAAGTGYHGVKRQIAQLSEGLFQKRGEGFPDICKVTFIIGKQNMMFFIQNCDLDRGGTDVNAKSRNLAQICTI